MADLPETSGSLFPDGLFGVKGWRRNQALIENYAEQILGDQATAETLDKMGQLGSVELAIEQARRAGTREEQKPYLEGLARLVDAVGVFDFEQQQAAQLNERITTSIADAAQFADVHEREGLAQLADGMFRAQERLAFDPSSAMEDMQGIEGELRSFVSTATERLNTQFISPLRQFEFDASGAEKQIRDAAGEDRWSENMPPHLVSQVLELAGANLGVSKEGKWSFSLPGVAFTPDQVPAMSYQQGLATLTSALRGKQEYVAAELERRGAPVIGAVRERLDAPPLTRREPASAVGQVGAATENVIDAVAGVGTTEAARRATTNLLETVLGAGDNIPTQGSLGLGEYFQQVAGRRTTPQQAPQGPVRGVIVRDPAQARATREARLRPTNGGGR